MADRLGVKTSRKDRSTSREGKVKKVTNKDVSSQRSSSSREGSRSSSCNTLSRESTPKPLPKHHYSRDVLMKLRLSPLCKHRPEYLDELLDLDLPEIVLEEPLGLQSVSTNKYDPEVWYKHIRYIHEHDSRGSSPLTLSMSGQDRKRYPDTESDGGFKRRGSDMRKEEEDDSGGIVLGPQRKSFGTGCHVTKQLSRRTDSPKDHERDSMRRGRIGSGRIQVDRDRERVNDNRDYRDRDARSERRFERHDSHNAYDHERERYSRNRGFDRDDWRERDGREFIKDEHYNNRRHNYNHNHPHSEPEWFTSGPTSQSDTIELVGFEGPSNEQKENDDSVILHENEKNRKDTCVSVADRNGSLETNESSSPEHSQHSEEEDSSAHRRRNDHKVEPDKQQKTGEFDFNEIFSRNIPGLCDMIGIEHEVLVPKDGVGSRFSQWFQPGSRGSTSRENSRRSSINEEFSYLNDLLNGSKSPVIPSPPLTGNAQHIYPSPVDPGKQHLIELLGAHGRIPGNPTQVELFHAQQHTQASRMAPGHAPAGAVHVNEVEASLKALLLQCNTKSNYDGPIKNIPHLVPPGGKVLTAEELEASLTEPSVSKHNISQDKEPVYIGRAIRNSSRSVSGPQNLDSLKQVADNPYDNSHHQPHVFSEANMLIRDSSLLSQNLVHHQQLDPTTPIKSDYERMDNNRSTGITGNVSSFRGPQSTNNVASGSNTVKERTSNGLNNPIVGLEQSSLFSNTSSNLIKQPPPSNLSHNRPDDQFSLYSSPLSDSVLQGGKVKTVAELEADLAQQHTKATVATEQTFRSMGHVVTTATSVEVSSAASNKHDMAAFNKLLGMVKVSTSSSGQQSNINPDHKRISEALAAQNNQQQNMNLSAQKEALTRRDMIQKLMQQQQQQLKAQAAAKLQHQQAAVAAAAQVKQLQQQQMLKQFIGHSQQQQQQQAGAAVAAAAIASLVGNKPRVSPIPPALNLQLGQANPSPRCPSPLLQPPVSPRAPSPIMFGSQPPMHLTAPSPIHASPTVATPNTLQVTPQSGAGGHNPSLARVPSPQELIVHTQAIMQNALIKKQLEDQKERYLRRQHERTKSPSAIYPKLPVSMHADQLEDQQHSTPVGHIPQTPMSNVSSNSAMTSTPATTKSAMNPAFTPTSVIRKMVSDKAEEKEKEKQDDVGQSENPCPILKLTGNDTNEMSDSRRSSVKSDTGNISIPVPMVKSNQVAQQEKNKTSADIQLLKKNVDTLVDTISNQQQKVPQGNQNNNMTPRPLIGQGMMHIPGQPLGPGMTPVSLPMGCVAPLMTMQPPSGAIASVSGPPPLQSTGRPIVKGSGVGSNSALSPPTQMLKTPIAQQPPAPPKGDGSNHRPIVGNTHSNTSPLDVLRLSEQQRHIQAQLASMQQQGSNNAANIPRSATTYSGSGIAITGRGAPIRSNIPHHHGGATGVSPSVASASQQQQAMLMQRMMMPQNTQGIQQQIQFAALQAQIAQQQQQHRPNFDPRIHQGPIRNLYNHPVSSAAGALPPQGRGIHGNTSISPAAAAIGRALTSQGHGLQNMPPHSKVDSHVSSSQNVAPHMNPILGSGNLAKFFGNDVIKQQLGSLPPLPNQGNQRVLTLEEIERKQQTVIN